MFSRASYRNTFLSPAKRSQHVNATFRNVVRRNMLRSFGHRFGMCWVLLAYVWPFSNLSQEHPICRDMSQHGGQTHATCCAQQCCDMLRWPMLRSFGRDFMLQVWFVIGLTSLLHYTIGVRLFHNVPFRTLWLVGSSDSDNSFHRIVSDRVVNGTGRNGSVLILPIPILPRLRLRLSIITRLVRARPKDRNMPT